MPLLQPCTHRFYRGAKKNYLLAASDKEAEIPRPRERIVLRLVEGEPVIQCARIVKTPIATVFSQRCPGGKPIDHVRRWHRLW
jgi:hypothetical protein